MTKEQLQYFSMDTLRQMYADLHAQRKDHERDGYHVVDIDALQVSIMEAVCDKETEPEAVN